MTRYLSAEKETHDDFGVMFTHREGKIVYDAKTKAGPCAMMTQTSYDIWAIGSLGLGLGQKYVRNAAGELHLVEGL